MSTSNTHILISFLVAFAMALPSLFHPSAAAAGAEGSATAAAAAPSPGAEDQKRQPAGRLEIPDLPLPRILPCPPWFPKIPLIPCFNLTPTPPPPPPNPRECRSSLRSLMPCAGFLTNASVPAPPSACCDGFDPFFANQSSPSALLCLCHIASADIAGLLPAPMNHTRAASVMEQCGLGLPIDALSRFCKNNRDQVPPIDSPSQPPAAAGTKAP
ncbi:unnamed protein product [Urochloa decumbens]|uniref:Bifunctional inhibitor/plant lipid transfer protein/seed storage helical domain-containing protein n=1 Tax=Urochloa decumbens TaxID=240449 RepID=A0ABC9FR47_9POAL